MDAIQAGFLKDFQLPKLQGIITFRALSQLAINILTLGVYTNVKKLKYQYRARQLETQQQNVIQHAYHLVDEWKGLERDLLELNKEFSRLDPNNEALYRQEINHLKTRLTLLRQDSLFVNQ